MHRLHVSVVVKSTSLWHWNTSRVFSLHGNKKLSGIINASEVHFSFQQYFEIFILILFLFDRKSDFMPKHKTCLAVNMDL